MLTCETSCSVAVSIERYDQDKDTNVINSKSRAEQKV